MPFVSGADVDARDATNWTALTRAAAKGYLECAEVLLRAGTGNHAQAAARELICWKY